jgi:D-3-phosphoglycerate dehydrogenase
VVRHFNRVGVLAGVLDELRNANINVEEMENSIFTGGEAAVCTLRLDDVPDRELVKKLRGLDNVIQVVLS